MFLLFLLWYVLASGYISIFGPQESDQMVVHCKRSSLKRRKYEGTAGFTLGRFCRV